MPSPPPSQGKLREVIHVNAQNSELQGPNVPSWFQKHRRSELQGQVQQWERREGGSPLERSELGGGTLRVISLLKAGVGKTFFDRA